MNKIAFYGYRDWAMEIYYGVENYCSYNNQIHKKRYDFELIQTKDEYEQFTVSKNFGEIDLHFFVGWNEIVDSTIVNNHKCICLHPSPLPKYRGGSPIQHQIINGEEKSAVTYFIMDEKIDHGDILWQSEFSLDGTLDDIMSRIIEHGTLGINKILYDYLNIKELKGKPQDHSKKTYFRRRTPKQSQLEESDFDTPMKAYNKIRALQSPYPNAYILCNNGARLYITDAQLGEGGNK